MKRRSFLKSLGAVSMTPMLPMPSFAIASQAAVIPSGTYKWAETIVRAHNKCTLGMLQRHLHLDAATANVLKSQLVRNGVIGAQANAYGIHKAASPLFDGAFMKPHNTIKIAGDTVSDIVKQLASSDTDEDGELVVLAEEDPSPEAESEVGANTLVLEGPATEFIEDEVVLSSISPPRS